MYPYNNYPQYGSQYGASPGTIVPGTMAQPGSLVQQGTFVRPTQTGNLPVSPYSENTGYPTPPPQNPSSGTGTYVPPMLGPGGTQRPILQGQMIGSQQQQQSPMSQNPYDRLMQMWYGLFPQMSQNYNSANGTNNSLAPQNGATTNYLSSQNPQIMQLLQHLFSGGSF